MDRCKHALFTNGRCTVLYRWTAANMCTALQRWTAVNMCAADPGSHQHPASQLHQEAAGGKETGAKASRLTWPCFS